MLEEAEANYEGQTVKPSRSRKHANNDQYEGQTVQPSKPSKKQEVPQLNLEWQQLNKIEEEPIEVYQYVDEDNELIEMMNDSMAAHSDRQPQNM